MENTKNFELEKQLIDLLVQVKERKSEITKLEKNISQKVLNNLQDSGLTEDQILSVIEAYKAEEDNFVSDKKMLSKQIDSIKESIHGLISSEWEDYGEKQIKTLSGSIKFERHRAMEMAPDFNGMDVVVQEAIEQDKLDWLTLSPKYFEDSMKNVLEGGKPYPGTIEVTKEKCTVR